MNESLETTTPVNEENHYSRRALLIANAKSRQGDSDLGPVVERLKRGGVDVIECNTGSAEESVQEIDRHSKEVDLVIIAGGDGTVHSCADALYRNRLPFAVLPLGTANDLAHTLSLPTTLDAIADLIIEGQQRLIDLGLVNGHLFFNAVNIGLGTEITHRLTAEVKKTWGVLSYLKAFWEALSRKRAFRCKVTVDGRQYRGHSIHITVGNGRFYGGGNVVDEEADISSGRLYLYSIKPRSALGLIMIAPWLRWGRHRSNEATFNVTGKHISISTSKKLEVHADGEALAHTPVVIEIIPEALRVYAPPVTEDVEPLTETAAAGE